MTTWRERDAAVAAVERVRALHVGTAWPGFCDECDDALPCPTIPRIGGDRVTEQPPAPRCFDCQAIPGEPHDDGCDVARCTECGWQRIGCDHEDADIGWGQVWTGRWPGEAEVERYGLRDMNDLAARTRSGNGLMKWDRQRQEWVQ